MNSTSSEIGRTILRPIMDLYYEIDRLLQGNDIGFLALQHPHHKNSKKLERVAIFHSYPNGPIDIPLVHTEVGDIGDVTLVSEDESTTIIYFAYSQSNHAVSPTLEAKQWREISEAWILKQLGVGPSEEELLMTGIKNKGELPGLHKTQGVESAAENMARLNHNCSFDTAKELLEILKPAHRAYESEVRHRKNPNANQSSVGEYTMKRLRKIKKLEWEPQFIKVYGGFTQSTPTISRYYKWLIELEGKTFLGVPVPYH